MKTRRPSKAPTNLPMRTIDDVAAEIKLALAQQDAAIAGAIARIHEDNAAMHSTYPELRGDKELLSEWAHDPELGELTPGAAVQALRSVRKATRRKGGRNAARIKKAEAEQRWQRKVVPIGKRLLNEGISRRKLAGILAERLGVDPQTVRTYLRETHAL